MLADAAAPTLFVRVPLPIVLAEVMDLAGLRQCRNMIWIPFLISRRGTIKFVSSTRRRCWEREKLIQDGSARVCVCNHQSSFSPPKPEDVDWITRRMNLFRATLTLSLRLRLYVQSQTPKNADYVSNTSRCLTHVSQNANLEILIDLPFGFFPTNNIISLCQSWDPRLDRLFNIVGFFLRLQTFCPLSRMPRFAQRAESRLYS